MSKSLICLLMPWLLLGCAAPAPVAAPRQPASPRVAATAPASVEPAPVASAPVRMRMLRADELPLEAAGPRVSHFKLRLAGGALSMSTGGGSELTSFDMAKPAEVPGTLEVGELAVRSSTGGLRSGSAEYWVMNDKLGYVPGRHEGQDSDEYVDASYYDPFKDPFNPIARYFEGVIGDVTRLAAPPKEGTADYELRQELSYVVPADKVLVLQKLEGGFGELEVTIDQDLTPARFQAAPNHCFVFGPGQRLRIAVVHRTRVAEQVSVARTVGVEAYAPPRLVEKLTKTPTQRQTGTRCTGTVVEGDEGSYCQGGRWEPAYAPAEIHLRDRWFLGYDGSRNRAVVHQRQNWGVWTESGALFELGRRDRIDSTRHYPLNPDGRLATVYRIVPSQYARSWKGQNLDLYGYLVDPALLAGLGGALAAGAK